MGEADYLGKSAFSIPLFIMTSDQTDQDTRDHFEENKYFGLRRDQVHFFKQRSLPCFDEESGKILMSSPSEVCMAPAGNGEIYRSLDTPMVDGPRRGKSPLQVMSSMKVEYVQIFNIDNLLAKVADPLFVNFAVLMDSEIVAKTAPKMSPQERVGVFAQLDNLFGVIEYSELGAERANATNPTTGSLMYNCANLSCYTCRLRFLVKAAKEVQSNGVYHAARKKIATTDGLVDGVKIESFIFDMFHLAKKSNPYRDETTGTYYSLLVVDRNLHFAPIKNDCSAQTDNPGTASKLYLSRSTGWAIEMLKRNQENAPSSARATALDRLMSGDVFVEISSLVSFFGEDLDSHDEYIVSSLQDTATNHIYISAGSEEVVEVNSRSACRDNMNNNNAHSML